MRHPARLWALALAATLSTSCLDEGATPEGLRRSAGGSGPIVTWDLDAKPLPDIPFPNDVATRLDPTSPTGRRVNISLEAPTAFERNLREKAAALTGFGIFSPITIGFEAPIDLCKIAQLHHCTENNPADPDPTNCRDPVFDDAVLLVNVEDGDHFGEIVPIDMGRGFFPTLLSRRKYFDGDPGTGTNLLLKDEPFPPPECPDAFEYDQNTLYEHETNTLILQPMFPLEEMSTYAVVVTNRVVGLDGQPVRSPFEYVNHTRQTAQLNRLEEALPPGFDLDDIAFTWAFTTQNASGDLIDIRRGMYGHGPFAALDARFPIDAETVQLHDMFDDEYDLAGNKFALLFSTLEAVLAPYLQVLLEGTADVGPLLDTWDHLDYLIAGEVNGPNFLIDRDDVAIPATGCDVGKPGEDGWNCVVGMEGDDDESFEVDPHTGRMVVGDGRVLFWCSVPKQERKLRPGPFPVAVYSHGYSVARIEILAWAGNFARHGIAMCAVEAFAHGLAIPPDQFPPALVRLAFEGGDLGRMLHHTVPGRARDINADGTADVGGDFYTADAFHTRDVVRQSVIDHLTVIKMLRSFDGRLGEDVNGDGTPEKMGDWNADGEIDLGGPDAEYYAWGTSMGGIHSAIIAAIEPAITAAAPNAGAAGLFDVAARSSLGAVIRAIWLPLMGPIYYGEPDGNGGTRIITIVSDTNQQADLHLATRSGLQPGDEIVVRNLTNGEEKSTTVNADGIFRVSIAADAMNASVKRKTLGFDALHPEHVDWGVDWPVVTDTTQFPLGDLITITACAGECTGDNERFVLDRLDTDADVGEGGRRGLYFQGTVYEKGTTLIAFSEGFGHERQTPKLRRIRGIAGFISEGADPAAYTKYYFKRADELRERWGEEGLRAEPGLVFGTNVMNVATLGDTTVPVNGEVMLAWTAGFFRDENGVDDFAKLRYLRDNFVLEAVEEVRVANWPCPAVVPNPPCDPDAAVLFDPDNLSNGTDGFEVRGKPAPRPPPGQEFRLTMPHPDPDNDGVYGMRIPAVDPRGAHVFLVPDPTLPFDVNSFMIHQIAWYLGSGGTDLRDDPCLATADCPFLPPP